ncbi:Transmembrane protein 68 [Strongyloides ratti]|uniref:Transmembrane protein 68 n=1 Tax=Strongyloides ratti TaxID=34506 RepID=A0A090LTD9_STRRB|nr:Transmembrane protein 68 [Strongyloides ratti]CEF71487.1 Transmembrane protein 68 [Strongyloides ratti]
MVKSDLITFLLEMTLPDWIKESAHNLDLWLRDTFTGVDFDYIEYLLWLFFPIIVAFVLPILLLLFIYGCVIFLHIYALRNRLREAYETSVWDGARASIASFWDAIGLIWHGYEVNGLENIPDDGPALLVYYHGTLPLDIYYLISKCILYKKRTLHCVGDKFIFKIPGWGKLCKVFCITPGTVEDCIKALQEGNLLSVAPGGVREAQYSNPNTYEIMWAQRLGFAKVVKGARCAVIPMFTENCREAFRTPRWARKLLRGIYEKTRLPICPLYGGFPVKMITHLGKPIYFDYDTVTPEEIKEKVKIEVYNLIHKHQRLPGSIIKGMLQRFKKTDFSKLHEQNTNESNDSNSINMLQRQIPIHSLSLYKEGTIAESSCNNEEDEHNNLAERIPPTVPLIKKN